SAEVAALERAGRLADAIVVAERALELAPLDEAVFRDLMRVLMRAENRTRAEAAGRGFVERLALDLGVSPSPETLRLLPEGGALPNGHAIVVVPAAPRMPRVRSVDSETATLTARGRHLWHQRTRASVERAIAYFTTATARDSQAVEAWAGLSACWMVMGSREH